MVKEKKYYLFKINVNILNIMCAILLVLLFGINYFIRPTVFNETFDKINLGMLLISYSIYMCFHEILHSISYMIYGADLKKIIYGVSLENGVLCCLCKQNINKRNILNSLMFPLFYLGILTYILGFIINSLYLIILSIFNISGCIGDIIMFLYIVRLNKNIEYTELDDPIMFAIYADEDVSKTNRFGLDYVGCVEDVCRQDFKKINISKKSYVLLTVWFVFCLACCLLKI